MNWMVLFFSALLVPLMWLSSKKPHIKLMAWGTVLILVFAGVFIAMAASETLVATGYGILISGRLIVWVMLWMLLVEVSKRGRFDLALLMSLFFLIPRGISCVLSDTLKFFVPQDFFSAPWLSALILLVELALVASALAVIGLISSSRLVGPTQNPGQHNDQKSDRHSVCERLGQEHGLTDRETFVLEYLSMGYTLQRIADAQYVSTNTIRTHTKGIYRKLSCHSKQDIIDLVNREMETGRTQAAAPDEGLSDTA